MFGNCSVSPGISNSFLVQEFEQRYKCKNQIEEKYLTKRRLADEDNGRRCKRGEVITREPGGGISWENLSVFTRQPHLPSAPAPASLSDLKAHLL